MKFIETISIKSYSKNKNLIFGILGFFLGGLDEIFHLNYEI
jgi:hypothetical protein